MTLRGLRRRGFDDAGGRAPTFADGENALLRRNFPYFVMKDFATLNPTETLSVTWYVQAMCAAGAAVADGRERRLIVNVMPRSLKSIIFSVALPAFLLGQDPALKVMCVSYGETLALELSRLCAKVMQSDWYQAAFPGTQLKRPVDMRLNTSAGGYRLATSVGAAAMGLGANVIIIDDPIKGEEAQTPTGRDKIDRFYRETLYGRFYDHAVSRIVLVMQRLHEDDLAGRLLKREPWTHLRFPAISDVDDEVDLGGGRKHRRCVGDLLDPVRFPQSLLDQVRLNVGTDVFSAVYLQTPTPASGSIIKAHWLKRYTPPLDLRGYNVTQSWDTAVKGSSANDPSACTIWAEKDGRHYLIDVFVGRLEFPDLVRKAAELHNNCPVRPTVLIEEQGSGVALKRMLEREYHIQPLGWFSKRDKAGRLSDASPYIERGQVYIPEDAAWLPGFLKELLAFPQVAHDDQVDSTSQYLLWQHSRTQFSASWI